MPSLDSRLSEEIFEKILNDLATSSKGLATLCKENHVSSRTFYLTIQNDKELEKKYVRAREEQADFIADEIIDIADDSSRDTKVIQKGDSVIEVENTEWTNRSKIRIEARKWTAGKLRPKKYGDKLDLTTDGDKIGGEIDLSSLPTETLEALLNSKKK